MPETCELKEVSYEKLRNVALDVKDDFLWEDLALGREIWPIKRELKSSYLKIPSEVIVYLSSCTTIDLLLSCY